MRKREYKNSIVFAMLSVMILILSACGKNTKMPDDPREIIELIISRTADINNVECSATARIDLQMSEMPLVMSMTQDMILFKEPYKAKINNNIDMGMFGAFDTSMYIIKGGDELYLYSNESGEWKEHEVANSVDLEKIVEQYGLGTDLNIYLDNKDSFTVVGTELINDKKATKIEGVITGESIKEAIDKTGIMDYLGDMDIPVDMFNNTGDMYVTVWIDEESLMPVKMYIDMTLVVQSIMDNIALIDEEVANYLGEVLVNECCIELTYSSFDEAEDFQLPKEIKNSSN